MNIQRQPTGLGSALRSAALGFLQPQRCREDEEELGNCYTDISDDYSFQRAYDDRAREAFGGRVREFVPSFLRRGESPRTPRRNYWEAPPEKAGLLKSLTPSFFWGDEEEDFAGACCPRMGFRQRVVGCACCFLVGQLIQLCSFGAVAGVLLGRPSRFAFLYTMGNVTMMSASFFLSGPRAQCRKITAKDRAKTSFVYLSSMAITLASAFSPHFFGRALLILLCVAVQWVALVWYVLSFVPYGHTMARRVLGTVCSCLIRR